MSILGKYKKQGMDGFKKFVIAMETNKREKRLEFLELCLLEDPVYTFWAMKNIFELDGLIKKLSPMEIENLVEHTPNGVEIFIKAFKNTEVMDIFSSEQINPKTQKEFKEALEYAKDPMAEERSGAYRHIMKYFRELVNAHEFESVQWELPAPDIVVEAEVSDGGIHVSYPNGVLAGKGEINMGLKHGPWEHFYFNGNKLAAGEYNKGKKTGEWEFYDLQGKLKSRGPYLNDAKHGEWSFWTKSGNQHVVVYDDDTPCD
jgi:hypothetical protein